MNMLDEIFFLNYFGVARALFTTHNLNLNVLKKGALYVKCSWSMVRLSEIISATL